MLRSSLILAVSLLATGMAWSAAPEGNDPGPAVAPETASQQFARARLMDMSRTLSGAEKFSVLMQVGYEVLQPNGQKIEFGEARKLAVQRPDRMRIAEQGSDGKSSELLFDGKQITILDGGSSLFAQAPQPGDIDATVVYFVRDLQMRLPLAPLLMKTLPDELSRRVQSVQYVEHTDILGKPAHHIAARTANTDFQVWIEDGERALPLRIVLSYPSEKGQPQFRADFSKWNLAPGFDKTAFAFKPPANARQILFAVQFVPVSGEQPPAGTAGQGEQP